AAPDARALRRPATATRRLSGFASRAARDACDGAATGRHSAGEWPGDAAMATSDTRRDGSASPPVATPGPGHGTSPSSAAGAASASRGAISMIGREAGPYRIVAELGAGGMGAVYLADQFQPVRRQVALKLIHAGLESADLLARFASERDLL